jgi:hypothetical protein
VRVYRGRAASDAVAGAGVATLGVADVMHMVGSMHVTNAQSTAEAAEALAHFGRFFLGELWDRYAVGATRA